MKEREAMDEAARGRPTLYRPEFAETAREMCANGATDYDLAQEFGVTTVTIWRWQSRYPEFCSALKVQKGEFDDRVKRGLAQHAVGYTYRAVKITSYEGEVTMTEYDEHVPPDPGAAKIWLVNRQPDEWRDRKELTGKDGAPLVPVLNVTYSNGRSSTQPDAS